MESFYQLFKRDAAFVPQFAQQSVNAFVTPELHLVESSTERSRGLQAYSFRAVHECKSVHQDHDSPACNFDTQIMCLTETDKINHFCLTVAIVSEYRRILQETVEELDPVASAFRRTL